MEDEQPEETSWKSLISPPGAQALAIKMSLCFATGAPRSKTQVSKPNEIGYSEKVSGAFFCMCSCISDSWG